MTCVPEFSRELALIVACMKAVRCAADTETLQQHLNQPLNWTEVVGLSERHRLVPHLYLALKNSQQHVPPPVWTALRDRFRKNARQNMRYMSELIQIKRMLEKEGIATFPFKGPVLALQLYDGLECRQFHDLDLAVPPEHAIRAAQLLEAMNYRTPYSLLPKLTPVQQHRFLAKYPDIEFSRPVDGERLNLELHWRLPFGLAIPTSQQPGIMQSINTPHGTLPIFPLPVLTLFLAHHGAGHRFFRMSWLADLLRAIELQTPAEWETLNQHALELGCQRHFLLGLAVLSRLKLLSHPVPDALQAIAAATRGLEHLVSLVFAAIADSGNQSQDALRANYWMFQLGGWQEGLHHLTTLFTPQPEDDYGRGTIHAYWHRWYRIFCKYTPVPQVLRQKAA